MSLIPSKRQHHFRPLCHLYLFILVFIYLSHPACGAAWKMPPALHVGGNGPPETSPPFLGSWHSQGVGMLPYGQGLLCVASEMRQTWEKWGQDSLLSVGVSDTTRARSALFPRTGGSLAKFYGSFWMRLLLGTHLRVPCQRTCSSSFPSGPGGEESPCSSLATHQLLSEAIGARCLFGVVSPNCPMPLTWYSCKSRIWASSLLVLPGRHSQLLHCRLLVKDLAG